MSNLDLNVGWYVEITHLLCDLKYTNVNMTGLNVNWLVSEVKKEIDAATFEQKRLHLETTSFLRPKNELCSSLKKSNSVAAAAFGAIGLFGGGISMGPSSCGLGGIFGSCQSEQNVRDWSPLFTLLVTFR